MDSNERAVSLDSIYMQFEEFVQKNKHTPNTGQPNGYAYFEEGQFFPLYPVYHLLSNISEKRGYRLIRYRHERHSKVQDRVKYGLLNRFKIDDGHKWPFRFFDSLGFAKNVYPKLNGRGFIAGIGILRSGKLEDKVGVLKWQIDGILVGDLFYDWHLRSRKIPTPKINSLRFLFDVLIFCCHFYWWLEQFEKQRPNFIFTSHSCYIQGLVARLGLTQNAKVFNVGDHWFHRLTKDRLLADLEFIDYVPFANDFNGYLHNPERANNALIQLTGGLDSTTVAHETVKYQEEDATKILGVFLKESNRQRVLIACHCFSDSPHGFGGMIFTDFIDWLEFLAQKSRELIDFDWYIKAHPSFNQQDEKYFADFCVRNPHITPIHEKIRSNSVLELGFECVLTCYGTIALEAAVNSILTISASNSFPSMKYSFARGAKTRSEYEDLLDTMSEQIADFSVDRDELLHFFDMHYLRKTNSWLWGENRKEMLETCGGYPGYFVSPSVLTYWEEFASKSQNFERLVNRLEAFIESDEYMLPI